MSGTAVYDINSTLQLT